jgi:hypothetical protein
VGKDEEDKIRCKTDGIVVSIACSNLENANSCYSFFGKWNNSLRNKTIPEGHKPQRGYISRNLREAT